MLILLDTHALLWFLSDSPRLPDHIRDLLLRQDSQLFFSSVSVLEIAIKHSLKPEAMPCAADAVHADAVASGIVESPFLSRHAQEVGNLPSKLRSAHKALAARIEPKVYEYGFLKR